MSADPPVYDLMLLLDATAPTERRAEIIAQVERAIDGGGEIVSKHAWGVRNLAYEIEHRVEADYELLQFRGPRELLEQLHRTLRLTDGVVRFRIIKLAPGVPEAPATAPPAPARVTPSGTRAGEAGAVAAPPAPAAGEAAAPAAVSTAADSASEAEAPAEPAPTEPEAPAEEPEAAGAEPEAAEPAEPAQDEAPAADEAPAGDAPADPPA